MDNIVPTIKIYSISLLSTVVFALTHGTFHLLFSQRIQTYLLQHNMFIYNDLLISNGCASVVSLFMMETMQWILEKYTKIIHSVYIDALGIIIGTSLIYMIHSSYVRKLLEHTPIPHNAISRFYRRKAIALN